MHWRGKADSSAFKVDEGQAIAALIDAGYNPVPDTIKANGCLWKRGSVFVALVMQTNGDCILVAERKRPFQERGRLEAAFASRRSEICGQ